MNVSDIDVSALGINVSSLDIKTETTHILVSKGPSILETVNQSEELVPVKQAMKQEISVSNSNEFISSTELLLPLQNVGETEQLPHNDFELRALFEISGGNALLENNPISESLGPPLPIMDTRLVLITEVNVLCNFYLHSEFCKKFATSLKFSAQSS